MAQSNSYSIPLGEVPTKPANTSAAPQSLLTALTTACEQHPLLSLGFFPDGPQPTTNNQGPPPTVSATDIEQQHQHPRWTFQPYAVEMGNNPIMAMNEKMTKEAAAMAKNGRQRRVEGRSLAVQRPSS